MTDKAPLLTATEELNAALTEAEAALRERNPGVSAETPLPSGGFLAWGKRDSQWQLLYCSESWSSAIEGATIPLHNASRLTRIEAARALNALLHALDKSAVEQAGNATQAASQARDFAAALRGTKD
jgi:hypothetical protein